MQKSPTTKLVRFVMCRYSYISVEAVVPHFARAHQFSHPLPTVFSSRHRDPSVTSAAFMESQVLGYETR